MTIKKLSQESGYTEDAIRSKIKTGVWLEDHVWKKAPDGRILMNTVGYEQWVEEQEYAQQAHQASR
ncbi:MAG: excisionase [Gammaproteobacteria bacterium]|nr:excisionase [Gammaproteobacteria bacterium]MDH3372509.1 excisionase [Gammaproteobacteria bacterium]